MSTIQVIMNEDNGRTFSHQIVQFYTSSSAMFHFLCNTNNLAQTLRNVDNDFPILATLLIESFPTFSDDLQQPFRMIVASFRMNVACVSSDRIKKLLYVCLLAAFQNWPVTQPLVKMFALIRCNPSEDW